MFDRRAEMRSWLNEIIQRFRQKGVISPEKAMTAEELGLPPRFKDAMRRRLGQSGIFVEVGGKYYLSEERLKQIEENRSLVPLSSGPRNRIMTLRIIQVIVIFLFIVLFLVSLFFQSFALRVISIFLLIVWLIISVFLIVYVSRVRRNVSRRFSPQ
jgi:hypothetical protein